MIARSPDDLEADGSVPWALSELTRMLSLSAAGAACVFASWAGSDSTDRSSTGQLWLIVGVVGLVLQGSGIASWLLMGTRRVRRRQARLLDPVVAAAQAGAAGHTRLLATDLVSTPTMTRYHRPDCELVAGKDAAPAALREHLAADRQPCGVCSP